jgi:Flp pilus assembly protein TadG
VTRPSSRGVVYVETLIAFPVILLMFFVTWQLFDYLTAHLIVRHAAVCAARAAAVIAPDEPSYYNGQPKDDLAGGQRLSDVRNAAVEVLDAHPHLTNTSVSVAVDGFSQDSLVTVRVSVEYHCLLHYVNAVCGGADTRTLESVASFPYQAADVQF